MQQDILRCFVDTICKSMIIHLCNDSDNFVPYSKRTSLDEQSLSV